MHFLTCSFQGFVTGIALSLMLGTVFFALVRNSLIYGYKTGLYIALGVITSDIIFISLALLSHGFAVFLKQYELLISIIGGTILALMGLFMFFKKNATIKEGIAFDNPNNSVFYFISNGFFINIVNPVNFFSWLTISSMLTIRFDYQLNDKIIFFSSSLVSIFLVEFLIAFGAYKIKPFIQPKWFIWVNRISGIIFLMVGLKLALGKFI